jgi:hypothetical protein
VAAGDFTSDLYVETGYVANTYIEDAYVEPGYVTGVIEASATLASQASVSAPGGRLRVSSASLTTDGAVLTASLRIRDASATLATSATVLAQPSATLAGSSSMSGALGFGITANLTIRPIASITTAATVSASAQRTRNAAISMFTSELWDEMGTWQRPSQETWQGLYIPLDGAILILAGSSSMPSAFSFTAGGLLTRNASANLNTTITQTTAGARQRKASTQLDSLLTFTVDGLVTRKGTVLKASSGTLSVDGRVTRNASANLTDALNFSTSGLVTRNGATLQASQATLTALGIKVTNASLTLSTFATLFAQSVTIGRPLPINSSATLAASGARTIGTQTIDLNANTSIFIRGGLNRTGTSTMNGFTSILAFLTIYRIDPFRIYAVPSETRSLEIVQEPRKKFVIGENRVNTIQDENRVKAINSETRNLIVQSLQLVDTPNSLVDTRK